MSSSPGAVYTWHVFGGFQEQPHEGCYSREYKTQASLLPQLALDSFQFQLSLKFGADNFLEPFFQPGLCCKLNQITETILVSLEHNPLIVLNLGMSCLPENAVVATRRGNITPWAW